MIKLGFCIECKENGYYVGHNNKEVPIIAGRCQFHYKKFRHSESVKRRNTRNKIATLPQAKKKDIELSLWYSARMNECAGRCAECNMPIPRFFRHASIAHVLPKRKEHGFPSVATHKENSIELGSGCGCHNKYDVSWLSASKMKIFPLAIEKFKIFYPFLTQEERARIPEVFLKHIE